MRRRFVFLGLGVFGLAACSLLPENRARADSMQAVVTQQGQLVQKLTAQRDSASRVLGDADTFIGSIDSSISRASGSAAPSRGTAPSEGPLEDQVHHRQDVLRRVNALVARARETVKEVAALKEREKQLLAANGELEDTMSVQAQRLAADAQLIAQLQGTIEQQAKQMAALQARLDEFDKQLADERTTAARAYYVIGTEGELLKKGVIVTTGGANLVVKRVGRTLVPARTLNQEAFTAIDTREVHAIAVPDSTKRYQIVSLQSLDDAKVLQRNGTSFRGPLEISDADKFWAASRYLIIVQR
jgi:uncharacterized coiled-coil protein SlyX